MNHLAADAENLEEILRQTLEQSTQFLQTLGDRPAGVAPPPIDKSALPEQGIGAAKTLEVFQQRYAAGMTGSAGSRYFGFVTGGTTPAAIAGDWLVSTLDQNVIGSTDSAAPYLERETLDWLRQLFGLSEAHSGTFVSGATMANFVGLAIARQWVAHQQGIDIAQAGLYALPPIQVFSGAPHSCIFKALSMLGMGKNSLHLIPCLPDREAIDIPELRSQLIASQGQPCIVVANAGTVNTGDFDDLSALAVLRQEFNFWLHVDAAFGGFAACSPQYRHWVEGMDSADSVAIDAHKWLNVPYDSAMQFTQHRKLQIEVFQNSAVYLGLPTDNPDFVHLTPENSRRLRALPAWFSVMAYGAAGYRQIVEHNCEIARMLGENIERSTQFRLLAPVRLNGVCFTLTTNLAAKQALTLADIQKFLAALNQKGEVFLTPTVYKGIPAIRAAFSNWRIQAGDVAIAWNSLRSTYQEQLWDG